MAAPPPPKLRTAAHEDSIWRQTVKNELKSAREWEPVWGFMRQLMEEEKKKTSKNTTSRYERLPPIKPPTQNPHASGLPSKLSSKLNTATNTSDDLTETWFKSYATRSIIQSRYPAEKYMFPATTNSEIGWKWGLSREEAPPAREHADERPGPRFDSLERFETGLSETAKFRREWAQVQKRCILEWKDDEYELGK
ncbi:hypothetical protein HDU67_002476 [Dinochytrium kinnereticum]|nr:hypothetical protein HDU67_002476 [Dinochytrium kinnereticum]